MLFVREGGRWDELGGYTMEEGEDEGRGGGGMERRGYVVIW